MPGSVAANEEFPERTVAEHGAVCPNGLDKNLFSMGDKQEGRLLAVGLLDQPAVVERGDNGLSGTRGGNQQVPVVSEHVALSGQSVKHQLLMPEWADLEPGEGDQYGAALTSAGFLERLIELVGVFLRVVCLKVGQVPIRVEDRAELGDLGRVSDRGEPNVPFQAIDKRRTRQVGTSHVCGVETGSSQSRV